MDKRREHDVCIAVINTLLQSVEIGSDDNDRITNLCLHTKKGTTTLVSVYALTLYADDKVKDAFYERLSLIVGNLPKHDELIIIGGFNAKIGADYNS